MEFTDHAIKRMSLRNVAILDVELVLAAPTRVVAHAHGTASHFGWSIDGRRIIVVTEAEDYDRVVTVMIEEER
ncbi:MAG: DUF4258 domain-containing protein [Patulibacter sp.]|nr:DUF4258 domain-containing protein [Patulibacter sp.]